MKKTREINAEVLLKYLPEYSSHNVPALMRNDSYSGVNTFDAHDKEIIFKVIRDMKGELNDLKKVVYDLVAPSAKTGSINKDDLQLINRIYNNSEVVDSKTGLTLHPSVIQNNQPQTIEVEETLSLQDQEIDMIKKALRKHKGKRKYAAKELGISERTLYRKINEYHIEE